MNKITSNLKFRMNKLTLFLVCMVLYLGIIPTIYAYAYETKLIKTHNGIINTRQIGENGPSVVFETGYEDALVSEENQDTWNGIQDAAAKYATTIAYDRFGLGKSSDIGNMPSLTKEQEQTVLDGGNIKYNQNCFNGQYKTPRDKAINLHDLLREAKFKKPYVLVAHSVGSFTAIEFAKMYKAELAGIIMLDGTFPALNRELYKWEKDNMPDLAKNYTDQFSDPDGNADEILIGGLQCEKDLKSLNNIPILYLQASETEMGKEVDQIWENGVINMISNSKFSQRVVVPNSTHYVYRSNPEFVNNQIKNFINKINIK
ncbi:alpha/beta hydrolase family protein [Clostridium puniceum]|uniref:Alpha/beta hydrolase family protein n=1 Tax=Clostridium puniceum TaxID=29367 RepID=A0A1S8TWZ6_9CLOT|nr:alpha/beta hydrolase [Clostridium puniceum]OOM82224.1 alpha/beta hydrolase family protein [Clostridium puniceum]